MTRSDSPYRMGACPADSLSWYERLLQATDVGRQRDLERRFVGLLGNYVVGERCALAQSTGRKRDRTLVLAPREQLDGEELRTVDVGAPRQDLELGHPVRLLPSREVELPRHAVAITNPAEPGAEPVVVERHEHPAAFAQSIEESLLFVAVFAVDPQ